MAPTSMKLTGEVIEPDAERKDYHDWKYEQQLKMYGEQLERRN